MIAYIEDPVVIRKILDHLKEKGEYQDPFRLPESRSPPQTRLFDEGKFVRESTSRRKCSQSRFTVCAVASGFLVKVRAGQKPLWDATFHAGSLIALAALFVEPLATQCYSSPWALSRR